MFNVQQRSCALITCCICCASCQQDAWQRGSGNRSDSQARLAGSVLDAMLPFLAPLASAYRVHTVFCAECTNNFDYKSIAAFWSHNVSGMPGGITRCAHTRRHLCTVCAPLPG